MKIPDISILKHPEGHTHTYPHSHVQCGTPTSCQKISLLSSSSFVEVEGQNYSFMTARDVT